MSLIYEKIHAVKNVGKFLDDLRSGPRMKKTELIKKIGQLTRHYPMNVELEHWHDILLKAKGYE